MKARYVIAIVLASSACAAANQRSNPSRPAPSPRSTVRTDSRLPLDPTRTAFIDDRSGITGKGTLRNQLRDAGLWKAIDQRDGADLVVTLAVASPTTKAARAGRSAYELTIRSTRSTSAPPLWQHVANSPEALVKRLKADVAPTFCFAVWCR